MSAQSEEVNGQAKIRHFYIFCIFVKEDICWLDVSVDDVVVVQVFEAFGELQANPGFVDLFEFFIGLSVEFGVNQLKEWFPFN